MQKRDPDFENEDDLLDMQDGRPIGTVKLDVSLNQ